jgi:exonuclease III
MRCDDVLATPALAAFAKTHAALRSPLTDMASDHYPVLASFEVAP